MGGAYEWAIVVRNSGGGRRWQGCGARRGASRGRGSRPRDPGRGWRAGIRIRGEWSARSRSFPCRLLRGAATCGVVMSRCRHADGHILATSLSRSRSRNLRLLPSPHRHPYFPDGVSVRPSISG